jgi:7,8-dihydro-6-hydroxymethylpterin-pyrophosphokinase
MHNRNFVLAPLAELAPNLIHPSIKKTMKEVIFNGEEP